MAIDELTAIVPPPASSKFDEDVWRMAEEILGFSLPEDYKDFARTYGEGTFCDTFLMVYCPSSSIDSYRQLIKYQVDLSQFESEKLYRRHPVRPGLLMWGGDENGHRFHWLTEGAPNSWPLIAESHEGDYQRFDLPMTSILAQAFQNKIDFQYIWGQPFKKSELNFVPR